VPDRKTVFRQLRGLGLRSTSKTIALAVAALGAIAALGSSQLTAAFSSTRTISFFHIHTKETVTVTYKKDGKLIPDAMDKIDWIMRDWRRNEKTRMDPATIDILWEMHTELGSKEPIHIICGYRSRGTNDMLRRTVGGQASESQHITGKAVDVTFPDVSLKQIRYAALVREQGGVGYYPTSGIPFVHVDTGRVRHWPRLPRYELALLFPNGQSQHNPSDGGPINKEDVRTAQSRHKDLAVQVASFFQSRDIGREGGKPGVQVADAGTLPWSPKPSELVGKPPVSAPKPAPMQVASLEPPRLMAEPKLVERPSRFVPGPSEADRSKLMELITFTATSDSAPKLLSGPMPAPRRAPSPRAQAPQDPGRMTAQAPSDGPHVIAPARAKGIEVAALDPRGLPAGSLAGPVMSDAGGRFGWGNGWVSAPAFDEEHPEELSYRPFPLAPLLTASASIDEPVLSRITAPDVAHILTLLDSPTAVPPMSFRPGQQTAEIMWAQQFKGEPVQLGDAAFGQGAEDVPTRLIPRSVKTTMAAE
jgi:uncharacterized protein YcbK (DUF882 family)